MLCFKAKYTPSAIESENEKGYTIFNNWRLEILEDCQSSVFSLLITDDDLLSLLALPNTRIIECDRFSCLIEKVKE